jgi:hypothetical protein
MADALMLLATGGGRSSSSSSHQNVFGGVGDDAQRAEQNIPGVQPLSNRSDSAVFKNFLRECHEGAAVIAAIPEGLGLGMFISLSRDDINGLSEDVGIQMLLRTTQTLVKGELATQPTTQSVEPIALVREPRVNAAARHPVDENQEPATAVRDNVDPYLVSQSVNTPAGRTIIYTLYGQHEGGGSYRKVQITVDDKR